MCRAGPQSDKRQAEDHGGAGSKAKHQRPDDGQPRREPEPGRTDSAHQSDKPGYATLIVKTVQDQRNGETGNSGCQLEKPVHGASLRFAVAVAKQNRG